MNFEAGAWHCFGEDLLTKFVELAQTLTQTNTLSNGSQSLATSSVAANYTDINTIGSQQEIRKLPTIAPTFIPDYTVTVKDDCTYLEISVNTYLSAYRATLMQRKNRSVID